MELLTSAQMRAIEQAAIASGSVTGLQLMERAGQGVVEAVMAEWPDLAKTADKAVVLCGPGNNGGDGFVVARLLKQRGWEVEVFLYGDADKLPPDARTNYARWCEMGAVRDAGFPEVPAVSFERMWAAIKGHGFGGAETPAAVVIDAVFGTGLARPAHGIAGLFDLRSGCTPHIYSGGARWVAVDIASGLCADSGRTYPPKTAGSCIPQALGADLTVTFHRSKLGHVLHDGPFYSGKCVVKDIGLPDWDEADLGGILDEAGAGQSVTDACWSRALRKSPSAHKFSHGHALILSGPAGHTGAARLAARSALRIGAGLVTVATPHDALAENAAHLTAIMLAQADTPDALMQILNDPRITALCIGPAFGIARAGAFLPAILNANRATVLDADALTALANDPVLFESLHEACILTPHAGEFKRLFPDIAARLDAPASSGPAYSKVEATRDAANRAGCTVVFKGPDTVIASPSGQVSLNAAAYDRAAPWLATAGSGDVLAGMITGLMARGFSPHHAAQSAACLHVEAARSFGPGLIAEDLPDELPKVFRKLGV